MSNLNNIFFNPWPHNQMGPRKLSEEEILRLIVMKYTVHYDDYDSFLLQSKTLIRTYKLQLNQQYSILGRLNNPDDAKQMYLAFVKKINKTNKQANERRINILYNLEICKKLFKKFPELAKKQFIFSFGELDVSQDIIKIPTEAQWKASYVAKIQKMITSTKINLQNCIKTRQDLEKELKYMNTQLKKINNEQQ